MSRVLLVGKGAPDRGGIPSFIDTLLTSELAREHDVTFLNVAHHGTPEAGRVTWGNLRRTACDAVAVWRSAGRHDIVHIHSALATTTSLLRAWLMAAAARSRRCGVLLHVHGGGLPHWMTTRWRRRLMALATLPAQRVVAVWSAGEQMLREVLAPERVRLVDNGVDVDGLPERASEQTPPRLLYVGLLTPRKGVLDLVEASRILRERGVAHELLLLGGTPDEGPAAEAEVRGRLDERVRLLGTRPPEEMPAAYAEAEVFCLPSWWEAMPLSVLEAMAAGLPVVTTDVGDLPRAVLDGETGFVVAPRSPQLLADALEKLLSDPALRQRIGAAGRARVRERFSREGTARAVGNLYEELGRSRT